MQRNISITTLTNDKLHISQWNLILPVDLAGYYFESFCEAEPENGHTTEELTRLHCLFFLCFLSLEDPLRKRTCSFQPKSFKKGRVTDTLLSFWKVKDIMCNVLTDLQTLTGWSQRSTTIAKNLLLAEIVFLPHRLTHLVCSMTSHKESALLPIKHDCIQNEEIIQKATESVASLPWGQKKIDAWNTLLGSLTAEQRFWVGNWFEICPRPFQKWMWRLVPKHNTAERTVSATQNYIVHVINSLPNVNRPAQSCVLR